MTETTWTAFTNLVTSCHATVQQVALTANYPIRTYEAWEDGMKPHQVVIVLSAGALGVWPDKIDASFDTVFINESGWTYANTTLPYQFSPFVHERFWPLVIASSTGNLPLSMGDWEDRIHSYGLGRGDWT